MTPLLSRYAESAFWLARYVERVQSLARIMEVNASFQRGRSDDGLWTWIVAVYADEQSFFAQYDEATPESIIRFYLSDLENPSSMKFALRAARENARALRPLISTDMWYQLNSFYNRLQRYSETDFTEARVSRTCEVIKQDCYAHLGAAESTLFRDESWPFFRLGMFIERADQTSRLLDVRFALAATGAMSEPKYQDFGFWAILLRSASAYHAFRRVHLRSMDPKKVAQFLIFNARFPRSIAFCAGEIQKMISQLRSVYRLRATDMALKQVEVFVEGLETAARDANLLQRLHEFNDWVQRQLILLTGGLGEAFFGHPRADETAAGDKPQPQSQSQLQSQPMG